MKVEKKEIPVVHTKVEFTFESPEQLAAFWCLFNYGANCNFLHRYGMNPGDIRRVIGDPEAYNKYHQLYLQELQKSAKNLRWTDHQ